jgi:hypothetical protein
MLPTNITEDTNWSTVLYVSRIVIFISLVTLSIRLRCFRHLCNVFSTITVAECVSEIEPTIAIKKSAFNKKILFTSKLDLYLGKKLEKCYAWKLCMVLKTPRKVDQKYLVRVKWGAGEGWRRSAA